MWRVAASTGRVGTELRAVAGAATAGTVAGLVTGLLTCAGNTALDLIGVAVGVPDVAGAPGLTAVVVCAEGVVAVPAAADVGCLASAAALVTPSPADAAADGAAATGAAGAGAAAAAAAALAVVAGVIGATGVTDAVDLSSAAATSEASVAGAGAGLAAAAACCLSVP